MDLTPEEVLLLRAVRMLPLPERTAVRQLVYRLVELENDEPEKVVHIISRIQK